MSEDLPKEPQAPEPKLVHVSCRANDRCEGTNAEVVYSKRQVADGIADGGGGVIRYCCQTCKGSWTVQY